MLVMSFAKTKSGHGSNSAFENAKSPKTNNQKWAYKLKAPSFLTGLIILSTKILVPFN
jgi:hypothetical protein